MDKKNIIRIFDDAYHSKDMATREIVDQAEKKPLTFDDLREMLQEDKETTKIMGYDDLSNIESLDELFEGDKRAVIILLQIETKDAPKVGHFIALLNKEDHVEHFDPYGFSVDQELAITHEKDYLGILFRREDKRIVTSKRRFQKIRESVNTCGRWCVVRIKHYNMSLSEFSTFIDQIHYEPDVAVTLMTLHL